MNFVATLSQIAVNSAYSIFSAWIRKTQPVDAIKEIITEVDVTDMLNSEKREAVYERAGRILEREWAETKGFVKDFAFAIAYDEFRKGI